MYIIRQKVLTSSRVIPLHTSVEINWTFEMHTHTFSYH